MAEENHDAVPLKEWIALAQERDLLVKFETIGALPLGQQTFLIPVNYCVYSFVEYAHKHPELPAGKEFDPIEFFGSLRRSFTRSADPKKVMVWVHDEEHFGKCKEEQCWNVTGTMSFPPDHTPWPNHTIYTAGIATNPPSLAASGSGDGWTRYMLWDVLVANQSTGAPSKCRVCSIMAPAIRHRHQRPRCTTARKRVRKRPRSRCPALFFGRTVWKLGFETAIAVIESCGAYDIRFGFRCRIEARGTSAKSEISMPHQSYSATRPRYRDHTIATTILLIIAQFGFYVSTMASKQTSNETPCEMVAKVLTGAWQNELGSIMRLSATPAGELSGEYNTAKGNATGWYALSGRMTCGRDARNPTVSFAVGWKNEGGTSCSSTAWSGQVFDVDGGNPRIETSWLLTRATNADDAWSATMIGQNHFTREAGHEI